LIRLRRASARRVVESPKDGFNKSIFIRVTGRAVDLPQADPRLQV
jgi:hypothetical protein